MSTPLLERFVSEARDLLEGAAKALLTLEKNAGDEAGINEVFRAVHTLKGSVGLFDFPAFAKLAHAAEDVLSAVREGQIRLNSDLVDLLLDVLDQVSAWVDAIARDGVLPDGADGVSRRMSEALRDALPSGFGLEHAAATDTAGALSDLGWIASLPEPDRVAAAAAAATPGQALLALEYLPAEDCFFSGEDPFGLFRQLPHLLALDIGLHTPLPPRDLIDPYRCLLRFRALTTATEAEIGTLFRYVIDELRLSPVPPQSLGLASTPPALPLSLPLSAMARRILEAQRVALYMQGNIETRDGRLAASGRSVAHVLAASGAEEAAAQWALALHQYRPEALTVLLERWLGAGSAPTPAAPATEQAGAAPGPAAPRPRAATSETTEGRGPGRVLKVDQARVDALMNLIGELVVSKNSLPFLAKRAEEIHRSREMSREIKDVYAVIDRLAQEMQGAIMAVRMLPVSEIFDRFPRLVRDVARKLGKHIDLVIEGEDTAADKNIIEVLGDPLLHIVRNAIDHGIETQDEREAAGKPRQAMVKVRAYQESDQVVIEVSDDGRGIDPVRMRAAAQAKGIIDAERAARLSDQEAINLIFYPGFSTAVTVSDLSGRGVGMDVVGTAVAAAGGTVMVHSARGEGTLVRLSLPLSMAVTRVMMVEAGGGMLFGIPMDHIAETVRVSRGVVRRIKQAEAFVLRDLIVPLFRLDRVLGLQPPAWLGDGADEDAVLVVRHGGALVGLVVDHFREGMDIILKPLEGILASIRGYTGTALLGDGRVLLVLNLKELL